jgi:hypothetical protein
LDSAGAEQRAGVSFARFDRYSGIIEQHIFTDGYFGEHFSGSGLTVPAVPEAPHTTALIE